ncbi:hypothetical protein Glove_348g26 [Diversispora epigaea]|uniref:Cas12f1-like TNB domain-containing protein n=1 Tax=Diversispora epigaea TaxID=1348612 RepID=A0A397HEV9_9GLOM|nr:hypothetical protein Glove_348g26 [Diversispora epigaea]
MRTKFKRRMTSQLKHCNDGLTPEELLLSRHLVKNNSIQLLTYEKSLEITNRHKLCKRPRSVIPDINVSAESNKTGELVKDLLSIVMIFVTRYNGTHFTTNCRKKRKVFKTQKEQKLQNSIEKKSIKQTKKALQAQYLNVANFNNTKLQWILETPYDIHDKIKSAENLSAKLHYNTRLVINQLEEFYLYPDVRTFITGYDSSEQAVKWGKNDISRIYQLSYIYNKIQSIHNSIYGKVHKQKHYKFRKFKIQGMVKRGKWQIHSKIAWMMLIWFYFQFYQYLLHKVYEYPWYQIIIYIEEYTSKTCGYCDHIHQKLDKSKVFHCPSYTAELDWDINDAYNYTFYEYPWYQIIIYIEEYTSKTCGYCDHIHQKLDKSKVFHCPSYTAELDWDINDAYNYTCCPNPK